MSDENAPQGRLPSLLEAFRFLGKQTVTAFVTTVTLSLAFMIFNDYIAPPPDLAGRWMFTVTYQDTSLKRYEGMQVTYQALLIQEDLSLRGTGEKVSEGGAVPFKRHPAKSRVNIELEGTINRHYFSPDELVIRYNEEGGRKSSTLHQLKHFDPNVMCGCFITTIADTDGTVWWRRVAKREDLATAQPVEKPSECKISCP